VYQNFYWLLLIFCSIDDDDDNNRPLLLILDYLNDDRSIRLVSMLVVFSYVAIFPAFCILKD
jgi:hypothetical protein